MNNIELLSPARNAEIGIEAINHGADAVYIGPPRFGARASASNSFEDIENWLRMPTFSVQKSMLLSIQYLKIRSLKKCIV